MELVLKVKAIQSLQSFSPDVQDDVIIFGTILGVDVQLGSPSTELLARIEDALYHEATQQQAPQSHQPVRREPPRVNGQSVEYVHDDDAMFYQVGEVDND
jgi:hypothetical protein